MPYSMTGFARQETQADWGHLSCEIRSVNHRYLEPTMRLPESLRQLEPSVRTMARKYLQRGKIEINVNISFNQGQSEKIAINTHRVAQLSEAAQTLANTFESANDQTLAPIDPLKLLQWPGVVEEESVDMELIETAATELIAATFEKLLAHRLREGEELKIQIEQRLEAITDYVNAVRKQMPLILTAQKEKLQQRIADLAVEIDTERLEQEIALIANKADVEEELDRLSIHITEVNHILAQTGPIGRRLDFMMQELNREANTLSSKAIHADTTQAAVSLKVLIEQMREQIQNIE